MSTSHAFSFDWFSGHIPKFQKYLAHLRGRPCAVIEIGAHEGRSTTWLLDNILTHENARIVTIDFSVQPPFWRNIEASNGLQKTQLYVGLSGEILRKLPLAWADFIYIDGSHGTPDVLEDAVLSFRLLKCGGIMAFDDYLWNEPKWGREGFPKPAVDAFLEAYRARIELLEKTYQVWIRKLNEQPAPPNQPVET
ncbi:MAG TPA: class I SAM-dependent methyltransferase [Rhizomicrobium sp.]|jgi:predicted O-methyltransferase YrrM|nr:class I SAM-dependent methyltransferase [Rhizomicrobium sp.]